MLTVNTVKLNKSELGWINIRSGWNSADQSFAYKRGWKVTDVIHPSGRSIVTHNDRFQNNAEAVAHVLEQAVCGDALSYKAIRYITKTNPQYREYKQVVRQIYRQYFRG